mgnify:CR=1 FL=1
MAVAVGGAVVAALGLLLVLDLFSGAEFDVRGAAWALGAMVGAAAIAFAVEGEVALGVLLTPTDGVYRAAVTEFGEEGTAALIWVCTVINAYNRIAISTRMVPPSPAAAG